MKDNLRSILLYFLNICYRTKSIFFYFVGFVRRSSPLASGTKQKKTTFKREFISLDVKILILDRFTKGEKASHITKTINLIGATIRTITRNKNLLQIQILASAYSEAARTYPDKIQQ